LKRILRHKDEEKKKVYRRHKKRRGFPIRKASAFSYYIRLQLITISICPADLLFITSYERAKSIILRIEPAEGEKGVSSVSVKKFRVFVW
jgi:hypothetical protein